MINKDSKDEKASLFVKEIENLKLEIVRIYNLPCQFCKKSKAEMAQVESKLREQH
jgi:hypothetical protein